MTLRVRHTSKLLIQFQEKQQEGGRAPHNFSYLVFPRHSMQPVQMECVMSSLRGGLGDEDLLSRTDKNHVGLRMSTATFNSSNKSHPYLHFIKKFSMTRHCSRSWVTVLQVISWYFPSGSFSRPIASIALIEAPILCACWALHQLAVCAGLGGALKRIASTQGCGWFREMGSAESCCVFWPPNGSRVDCEGQLADKVVVQSGKGDGTSLISRTARWPVLACRNNAGQCLSVRSSTFYLIASQFWSDWK